MARSKLLEILQGHGVKAYTRGGNLYALKTDQDEAGFVHDTFVRLHPTLRAVRYFLGY